MVQTKTPRPLAPETLTNLRLATGDDVAAGFTAVASSFRHVLGSTGFWRGNKALLKLNQKDGYDCPSCAWPDPDHGRSPVAEYCESGAKAVADEVVTKHTASPVLFQRYSVLELAEKSDLWLGQQGRLTHPMVLREGATHYEKIEWGEAFQLVGNYLKSLASPNEAIFYTSGRTSNEAAFLYQLFVRAYGTNNLPDCSNMCHESTTEALTETLGLGKASVKLDDFAKAEVIVILGQNPGTNAPRMMSALEEGKRSGAKIIAINPLVETGLMAFRNPQNVRDVLTPGGTKLADLYLQVRINADMQLLKALLKLVLEAEAERPGEVVDQEFISRKTTGFEALKADLDRYSLGELSEQCGVPLAQLREAADLLARRKRIIVCWAMGLTQHQNAVQTIREIVNLLLMKGSIGLPGAGTCPVRGHSNVQGDRTMGIYEKPKGQFLDKLKDVFGFEPPREPGYSTVEAVQAMHNGRATVFFGMGGNFVSAVSDTEFTAEALRKCDLTVHVSTKLNRSHLVHGQTALILPCLGRSEEDHQAGGEQFVTMENTTGVVHSSRGSLKPVADTLRSETAIVAGIAKATLGNTPADWDALAANYDRIRELIEKTIPGFENYNQRVRKPGGFYLPNSPRQGRFDTPDEKAHFTVNAPTVWKLAEGEFLLMSIRSHDQFNTTLYGLNDRYRGIFNERRVLMMNEADIQAAGLQPRQVVDLHSHYEGTGGVPQTRTARRFIVVPYNIPTRCVAAYFPETNPLIPIDQVAERSLTPISKSVRVTLEKVDSGRRSA